MPKPKLDKPRAKKKTSPWVHPFVLEHRVEGEGVYQAQYQTLTDAKINGDIARKGGAQGIVIRRVKGFVHKHPTRYVYDAIDKQWVATARPNIPVPPKTSARFIRLPRPGAPQMIPTSELSPSMKR